MWDKEQQMLIEEEIKEELPFDDGAYDEEVDNELSFNQEE